MELNEAQIDKYQMIKLLKEMIADGTISIFLTHGGKGIRIIIDNEVVQER